MIRRPTIWALVADGSRARLFETDGSREDWRQIDVWDDPVARLPARDLETGPPFRNRKIGSGGHFAIDRDSEHEKAEEAFAAARAENVNAAAARGAFDKLVLCAPPRTLAVIRRKLSEAAQALCVATLDKDYTGLETHDIQERLAEPLRLAPPPA